MRRFLLSLRQMLFQSTWGKRVVSWHCLPPTSTEPDPTPKFITAQNALIKTMGLLPIRLMSLPPTSHTIRTKLLVINLLSQRQAYATLRCRKWSQTSGWPLTSPAFLKFLMAENAFSKPITLLKMEKGK